MADVQTAPGVPQATLERITPDVDLEGALKVTAAHVEPAIGPALLHRISYGASGGRQR